MLPLVFSAASLLFCGFFFFYFHRYIRRRTSPESILAECADAVDRLEAQIDAITDRDARLVEERIKSLKKLLEDVDRRISLLSRIEDQRKPLIPLYNSLGNRVTFPSAPPASKPVPEDLPGPAEDSPPEPGEDPRPLVERVAELDRAGLSPELIASRLGVSVSEAELAVTVSRRPRPGGA